MRLCSITGCGKKHHAKGLFKVCYNNKYVVPAWRKSNPEKSRSIQRTYIEKPGKREQNHASVRRWSEKNPERIIAKGIRLNKFSLEILRALLEAQGGSCAICKVTLLSGQGPAARHCDHCHESGKPRGLLCSTCNKVLGHYETHLRKRGVVLEPFEVYLNDTPVSKYIDIAKLAA